MFARSLESIRQEDVQIIILDSPEIYLEYEPYEFILDLKEFIDCVCDLNKIDK